MTFLTRLCSLLLLLVTGCASNPLPDDYKGDTAVLRDSYTGYDDGGLFGAANARFFVASKINGKPIPNAVSATTAANYGRRFAMTPVPYERRVPTKPVKVELYGHIEYAAPIAAMLNKTYETHREVTFTPVAGGRYVVRGNLADQGSSVWIETEDGRVVAQ